jgi:hypothetical protein
VIGSSSVNSPLFISDFGIFFFIGGQSFCSRSFPALGTPFQALGFNFSWLASRYEIQS